MALLGAVHKLCPINPPISVKINPMFTKLRWVYLAISLLCATNTPFH